MPQLLLKFLGGIAVKKLAVTLAVSVLKMLIEKLLIPKMQKMAEASENKIDDILVAPENVENAKKIVFKAIDMVKESV